MSELTPQALYTIETKEEALERSLQSASDLGLPTTDWHEGEPTLTLIEHHAARDAELQAHLRPILAGGLLSWAEGDHLTLLCREVYETERIGATRAGTTVTVSCAAGFGPYTGLGAGDLIFANTVTDKTYTSTSGGTAQHGVPLQVDVLADEAGSGSSAAAGEITTVVTGLLGLSVTNVAAAIGLDGEADEPLRARARFKPPDINEAASGPKGKYAYTALDPKRNNGANVTRVAVRGDTMSGLCTVVLGGPSGQVSEEDRAKVESALVYQVIGPVENLSVLRGPTVAVDVTYTLWIYDDVNLDTTAIETRVAQLLARAFRLAPIGGWSKTPETLGTGKVWVNLIEAVIKSVSDRAFEVSVSIPASDYALLQNDVLVVGTITPNVVRVAKPESGGT
jgi:hypothetical protein